MDAVLKIYDAREDDWEDDNYQSIIPEEGEKLGCG